MAEPGAFQASFVDVRLIRTRGVTAFVFEVPSERAEVALRTLGGMPSPSNPQVDVAIARIRFRPDSTEPPMDLDQDAQGKDAIKSAAAHAREMPFQRWILGPAFVALDEAANEAAATMAIRKQLGITSRKELRTNLEALKEWRALVARYESHKAGA